MSFGLVAALAVIAAYLVLLYRGIGIRAFTIITAVLLGALSITGVMGPVGTTIAALVFVPLALVFNVVPLRRSLLSRPLFGVLRHVLPKMSDTEREALEAGQTWWEADLFGGRPDWKKLLDFDYTKLTDAERKFLEEDTEELCAMIDEWEVHFERKDLPPEVWDFIRKRGFCAMLIDRENGGLGFSSVAQSYIVSKIATRSITAAVTVMVPNSLGPGELLQHYGTDDQKAYWLPRLASGEEIPCFGLTGPEAGSDAGSIPDTGVVCKRKVDGKEQLGISLTFDKRYITLAPVATVVGLAFRLQDPDGLMGDSGQTDYGITCALIKSDTPGVEIGRRHYPGGAFMNGPIRGKDVFVPMDAIIGGPEMAGKGWRMLVECLSAGRGISLPALAAASGGGMMGATGAYCAIRRQFNLPIGRFEGVQEALARIGGNAYTLEASRVLTASAVDHCAPAVVTAMMKYHSTEMMRGVLVDAMDIHSGRGIIMGPRNYLAVPWQLLPVAITVEGANIMTRSLIIFGQGAIRCHPYLYAEMQAVHNDDLAEFDSLLWSHIGYSLNRAIRAVGLSWTGAKTAKAPVSGPMAPYYRQIERLSASLALCADVSLGSLGGELKLRESTSARLGDVLSHMYLATSILRFHEAHGRDSKDHTLYARWALDQQLALAGEALSEFFRNFPRPLAGGLLRRLLMPFGQPWRRPTDVMNAELSECMMRNNDVLSYGIDNSLVYIGSDDSPIGRLMKAFELLQTISPRYDAFLKAVSSGKVSGENLDEQLEQAAEQGVVNKDDIARIREYDALRYECILTDDFDPEYLVNPAASVLNSKESKQAAVGG